MKMGAGAILLFTLISPPLTQAQERVQVSPGDRVRVTSGECFQEAKDCNLGPLLWAHSGLCRRAKSWVVRPPRSPSLRFSGLPRF